MPLILLYTDDVPVVYKLMVYGFIDYFMELIPKGYTSVVLLIGHISLLWFSLFNTKYHSPYHPTKKNL